jgi:hypothetical protein
MNNPNEAILLTEDGHPIGDLVVASGSSVDTTPTTDAENEETNREVMRRIASDITGDPDPDSAVAEIFEGIDDADKRRSAMRLFVVEHRPITAIAKEVGVPERTVSMWMYEGKWSDIAGREVEVRRTASLVEMEMLRSTLRSQIAREQLDAARTIRRTALDKLASNEVSVKSAAESVKSASDVEARILGISETGALDRTGQDRKEQDDSQGKKPLVVIFNGGLPPRMR